MNVTNHDLKMSKQELRKAILELRNNQPSEIARKKSDLIIEKVLQLEEYLTANIILLYSGKETEVQTESLIRAALREKRVVLPITNAKKGILELSEITDYDRELEKATFSILEPKKEYYRRIDIDIVDLIVVPGVVFDYRGHRLGYGFGYYDKLLTVVSRPIPFIGLAFEFQVKASLPNSDHDIPVHKIVTENRIIPCNELIIRS